MKIATIGTGVIVDNFMDGCYKNKDISISCMYTRNKNSANELSKKYGIDKIYTDLKEMLNDDSYDFIYIASPNSLHFSQTKMALESNKHVICEKPFTSTSKELKELITLAKQNKLFLFEAITTIYLPHLEVIKNKLESIGKIHMINCNFSKYSSRYKEFLDGKNPNIFNPDFSGGALVDLNVYNIHYVLSLFGLPTNSNYIAHLENNGIDTSGVAILEYPDKIATCISSKNSDSECYTLIQGEDGFIKTSAAGGLHEVIISTKEGVQKLNLHQDPNNLFYEVSAFKRMFDDNDLTRCYNNLDYSYSIIGLIEKLRKDAKIVFKDDKE